MGKYSFPHNNIVPINCFFQKYEERTQGLNGTGSFFIALTRDDQTVYSDELILNPTDADTEKYLRLYLKTIFWIYGGDTLYGEGLSWACELLEADLSFGGALDYEIRFFSGLYSKPLSFVRGRPRKKRSSPFALTSSQVGMRVGIDLGASSIKAVLLNNGDLVKSEIVEWSPSDATHGDYILDRVIFAIDSVCPGRSFDAIGISTAGIVSNNEIISSSLYRSLVDSIRLIETLKTIYSSPVTAVNDGDAAALAVGQHGVLSLALGSDLGGGLVNESGEITGNLNELAFVPMDIGEDAPICEWSGHRGTGGVFLSKRGRDTFDQHGIDWSDYSKSMGLYIAHSIPWFKRFCSFHTLALYGGIASEQWGEQMIESALQVLEENYPTLAFETKIIKADSENERFQQAIAASRLAGDTL